MSVRLTIYLFFHSVLVKDTNILVEWSFLSLFLFFFSGICRPVGWLAIRFPFHLNHYPLLAGVFTFPTAFPYPGLMPSLFSFFIRTLLGFFSQLFFVIRRICVYILVLFGSKVSRKINLKMP